jgi:hypothetical protein
VVILDIVSLFLPRPAWSAILLCFMLPAIVGYYRCVPLHPAFF